MEKKIDTFLLPQLVIHQGPMEVPEFGMAFAIDRMTIFEVYYYQRNGRNFPQFTTMAGKFLQNKKDWQSCGQCQEDVLSGYALEFFRKWDYAHLKELMPEKYYLMRADLVILERAYISYKRFKPDFNGDYHFRFDELKDLSMHYKKQKGGM